MVRLLEILVVVVLTSGAFSFVWAQSVPDATGSKISREEAQEALDFHNEVRKDVRSPPLEWSAELAGFAQAWADELAATGCKMKHRPSSGKWRQEYGENIYWCSGFTASARDASENWHSEIRDYKHQPVNANIFPKCGHYTQMVWKDSRRLGIGVAKCRDGEMIIVANYDPPGNYFGDLAY